MPPVNGELNFDSPLADRLSGGAIEELDEL